MPTGKLPRSKFGAPQVGSRQETRFAPQGPGARELLKQWANIKPPPAGAWQQPSRDQCGDVSSTAINSIGYDNRWRRLSVTFNSGRTYDYDNVGSEIYQKFCSADSKGRFFNQWIRNYYAYRRVS